MSSVCVTIGQDTVSRQNGPPPAVIAGRPATSRRTGKSRRRTPSVLIVDDSAEARDIYTTYFRFRGLEVSSACEGIEALRWIHMRAPDVVVLDLSMPHMSGWDVLREIRRSPASRDTRVIILTGFPRMFSDSGALRASADSYLMKPYPPERLLEEIRRVFRSSRRR